MDRRQAIAVLEEWIALDEQALGGKIESDFDRFIAEKDEALRFAIQVMRSPLKAFIAEEVPHRLSAILSVPTSEIDEEVAWQATLALYKANEVMFDYQGLDQALKEILDEMGI